MLFIATFIGWWFFRDVSVRRDPPRWPWLRSSFPGDSNLLNVSSFSSTLRGIQCLEVSIGIKVRMGSKNLKILFFSMTILTKKSSKNKQKKKPHKQLPFLPTICHTVVHLGPPFCCHGMEKTEGWLAAFLALTYMQLPWGSSFNIGTWHHLGARMPHRPCKQRHTSFFVGSLLTFNHRNSRIFVLSPTIQRKPQTVPHC